MKKTSFLSILLNLSFLFIFSSCEKMVSHVDDGSKIALPEYRTFVLNQGSSDGNNAGIAFLASDKDTISRINDIYSLQNEAKLGDLGQDMIVSDNQIYVLVSGSKYVARLNASCVEQCRHSFIDANDGTPRSLAIHDGHLYISMYGGTIVKLNAETLEEESRLQTQGSNLEEIAICNGNLYVANAWAYQNNIYDYLTELLVIDIESFQEKEPLQVVCNPNYIKVVDDKIFLLSFGNYYDIPYTLQMIDVNNDYQQTGIGTATQFTTGKDKIFMANCQTDWTTYATTTTLSVYDIKTGNTDNNFFKNIPSELSSSNVYVMSINPFDEKIYIGTTDYYTNGKIYCFDADGNYEKTEDCGGLNPYKMVFLEVPEND